MGLFNVMYCAICISAHACKGGGTFWNNHILLHDFLLGLRLSLIILASGREMVLVPSQKPYFEVNITTKPFQMPRACDKGAQTGGQHYSITFCWG